MIAELTNHLWQSTLFAIAAGLLAITLRNNRAPIRFWLWFSASLKFLVPFALLMSLGNHLDPNPAASTIAPAVSLAIEQVAQPFSETALLAPSKAGARDWMPAALLAAWACGFAAISLIRFRGWLRIRAAVRSSLPIDIATPVEVRSSPGLLEPGVVGFLRPILLLPADIAERLSPAQLEAVLAHELCHVRRRDNLFAAFHMIVEATFWFHPLVWWIGARLVEERERACDEEVLRLGSQPQTYAEGILNVCRLYLESPLACMSGVTGADLRKRIESIMTNRLADNLTLFKRLTLGVAAIAAVAGPVFIGILTASAIRAQSHGDRPAFDVASVKLWRNVSGGGPSRFGLQGITIPGGNLVEIISEAYQVPLSRISTPSDLRSRDVCSARYEIAARTEHPVSREQLMLMLRTLLEDRFKLALHHEPNVVPVYKLVVGKSGSRLKESTAEGPASSALGPEGLAIRNTEMWRFCAVLSGRMGRPVVDFTGLKGRYDFTLKLDLFEGLSSSDPEFKSKMIDWSSSSIFSDIPKQLGLELQSEKAPVNYLVIDRVENPSEN